MHGCKLDPAPEKNNHQGVIQNLCYNIRSLDIIWVSAYISWMSHWMHHILCDSRTEWPSPDIGTCHSTLNSYHDYGVKFCARSRMQKQLRTKKKYSYYHILCDARTEWPSPHIGANPPVIIITLVSNFVLGHECKNTRRGVINWGFPTKYSYHLILILCDVRTEWCSPILVLTNSQQSSSFWCQMLVQMEGCILHQTPPGHTKKLIRVSILYIHLSHSMHHNMSPIQLKEQGKRNIWK